RRPGPRPRPGGGPALGRGLRRRRARRHDADRAADPGDARASFRDLPPPERAGRAAVDQDLRRSVGVPGRDHAGGSPRCGGGEGGRGEGRVALSDLEVQGWAQRTAGTLFGGWLACRPGAGRGASLLPVGWTGAWGRAGAGGGTRNLSRNLRLL